MMGRQNAQEQLFYSFLLKDRIPADHLLRSSPSSLRRTSTSARRTRSSNTAQHALTRRPTYIVQHLLIATHVPLANHVRAANNGAYRVPSRKTLAGKSEPFRAQKLFNTRAASKRK